MTQISLTRPQNNTQYCSTSTPPQSNRSVVRNMTQISLTPPQSNTQPSSTSTPPQSNTQPSSTSTPPPPQSNTQPSSTSTPPPPQSNTQPSSTSTPPQSNIQPSSTSTHSEIPYSAVELRQVLIEWHRASPEERPAPFPGPLEPKEKLITWVYDIRKRSEDRGIPRQQWANVLLSWIPQAPEGKYGFREELLEQIRGKRASGEWENGRFWKWEKFRYLFLQMCAEKLGKNRIVVGLAGTAAAVALPIVGLPVLGALGFTSAGIAGGSVAAGVQSAGFAGAAFSALQSIGARAAFPIGYNFVVGAIGSGAAAVATAYNGNEDLEDDDLGDIGDEDI